MAVTRWETSRRPLFVKTVWKNGHRHVELRGKVAAAARTATGRTTSRSTSKKTPTQNQLEFKVPAVKVFLASLRDLKRSKSCKLEETRYVKAAVTIDIVPGDSLRYSDLNKQVCFDRPRRLHMKATSFDVPEMAATPPPYEDDVMEPESLSDRVMIWLDLAVQNHKFKDVDVKKVLKKVEPKRRDHFEECNFDNNLKIIEEKKKKEVAITSKMEFDKLEEVQVEERRVRTSTGRRQLHIFLPNLPKRSSESGSFLSSKGSSQI